MVQGSSSDLYRRVASAPGLEMVVDIHVDRGNRTHDLLDERTPLYPLGHSSSRYQTRCYHLREDKFGQFERLNKLGKIIELMSLESYQDLIIIVLVKLYKIVVLLMMQMG